MLSSTSLTFSPLLICSPHWAGGRLAARLGGAAGGLPGRRGGLARRLACEALSKSDDEGREIGIPLNGNKSRHKKKDPQCRWLSLLAFCFIMRECQFIFVGLCTLSSILKRKGNLHDYNVYRFIT